MITEMVPMREKIMRLESELQALAQVDCPVEHIFAPGVYVRKMFIPAGTAATGAVHKTEHITIISQGHLMLMTDDGVQEVQAPFHGLSKPGIKRVAFTLTDTVLTTIHATTETDIEKLVIELTESTQAELLGGAENKQLIAHKLKELT